MCDRTEIASRIMTGYLASPHFKFEDLADYARKARVGADLLLDELRENPRELHKDEIPTTIMT